MSILEPGLVKVRQVRSRSGQDQGQKGVNGCSNLCVISVEGWLCMYVCMHACNRVGHYRVGEGQRDRERANVNPLTWQNRLPVTFPPAHITFASTHR